MLLAIAFALFLVMLVSWFVAPSAETSVKMVKDAPAVDAIGAALQH